LEPRIYFRFVVPFYGISAECYISPRIFDLEAIQKRLGGVVAS
jgi:hypothetical protein